MDELLGNDKLCSLFKEFLKCLKVETTFLDKRFPMQ